MKTLPVRPLPTGEFRVRFFKRLGGQYALTGNFNRSGPLAFLAPILAARIARDYSADAFEVTAPSGRTRRYESEPDGVFVCRPLLALVNDSTPST
jgi:hypothetical protein